MINGHGVDMLGKMSDGIKMGLAGHDEKIDLLKARIATKRKIRKVKQKLGHIARSI